MYTLRYAPLHARTHAGGDSGESGGQPSSGSNGVGGTVVPSFAGRAPLLGHLLGTERAYVERLRGFKVHIYIYIYHTMNERVCVWFMYMYACFLRPPLFVFWAW